MKNYFSYEAIQGLLNSLHHDKILSPPHISYLLGNWKQVWNLQEMQKKIVVYHLYSFLSLIWV